jgi:endonuclease YncB( thermonuclease family)
MGIRSRCWILLTRSIASEWKASTHQAFGLRWKQNLSELIFGKDVTVAFYTTDQYRRLVGEVLLDGRDIDLEQVKAGMAWH